MTTTRILFVDDEQQVLDGLRRMLHRQRNEWSMQFVVDPLDVIPILDTDPVDVVVTDMRMPGLDGLHLLEQIKQRHPDTVRIILSGQFDTSSSLELIGVAHQFLAKPCDADELIDVVRRAGALRARIKSDSLLRLVSGASTLPSPPARFAELMRLVRSPDSSLIDIADVISTDAGMTAKVLQLVNSSFFGLRRRVTDPTQAVALLGLDNLVALALGAHVFTRMSKAAEAGLDLDGEHDRTLKVAVGCEAVAKEARLHEGEHSAYYLSGMLHDVGRLVLAANYPERYRGVAGVEVTELVAAERAEFESSHQEVGAYLLGVWGLPDVVVEATAYHHDPAGAQVDALTPLTAVHIAQALADAGDGPPAFDEGYLARCGPAADVASWKTAARQAMARLDMTDEDAA
jgi:HD-like signal output (HDOD) protein/ActR/RegA family two-component response regulator